MRPQTLTQCTTRIATPKTQVKFRPPVGGRLLTATALVALIGVLSAAAGGRQVTPLQRTQIQPGDVGPIVTWLDDLIQDLEDMEDNLDDAETTVAEQQGPLVNPDLSRVSDRLDSAMAIIDRILDPLQYPSLAPSDAGDIDYSVTPSTLPEYADKSLTLAQQAAYEAKFGAADDDYIGSCLKTIKYLITRATPHNYRTESGIE